MVRKDGIGESKTPCTYRTDSGRSSPLVPIIAPFNGGLTGAAAASVWNVHAWRYIRFLEPVIAAWCRAQASPRPVASSGAGPATTGVRLRQSSVVFLVRWGAELEFGDRT